jgi:hypothetical protein
MKAILLLLSFVLLTCNYHNRTLHTNVEQLIKKIQMKSPSSVYFSVNKPSRIEWISTQLRPGMEEIMYHKEELNINELGFIVFKSKIVPGLDGIYNEREENTYIDNKLTHSKVTAAIDDTSQDIRNEYFHWTDNKITMLNSNKEVTEIQEFFYKPDGFVVNIYKSFDRLDKLHSYADITYEDDILTALELDIVNPSFIRKTIFVINYQDEQIASYHEYSQLYDGDTELTPLIKEIKNPWLSKPYSIPNDTKYSYNNEGDWVEKRIEQKNGTVSIIRRNFEYHEVLYKK